MIKKKIVQDLQPLKLVFQIAQSSFDPKERQILAEKALLDQDSISADVKVS